MQINTLSGPLFCINACHFTQNLPTLLSFLVSRTFPSIMPTTFLTGGNGFVGATVFDQLLAKDHKVIAAVRSQSSGEKLLSIHPEWDKSRINFVEVPDFSHPDAFDSVFQDNPEIDYIVHVAAPLIGEGLTDFVEHYEKPTVTGNVSLLQAAKKYGKNIKAIAVTGSINAITTGDQNDIKNRVLDSTQWLPMGREEAIQMKHPFVRAPLLYPPPMLTAGLDHVLRRQKALRRSNLEIHARRKPFLHSHRLQSTTPFRTHAPARDECRQSQLQRLPHLQHHELRQI